MRYYDRHKAHKEESCETWVNWRAMLLVAWVQCTAPKADPAFRHWYAVFCCHTRTFCPLATRFAQNACQPGARRREAQLEALPMRRHVASIAGSFSTWFVEAGLGHLLPFFVCGVHTGIYLPRVHAALRVDICGAARYVCVL